MNFQFLFMTGGLFSIPILSGIVPILKEVLIGIVFGYILYFLFIGIAYIITFAQELFNMAAGVNPISLTPNGPSYGGGSGKPDLIIGLMRDNTVSTAFFTILGVCLVLLVIFTIIAVIKTEFSLEYTSKAPIISRALTSLANFFVIPIMFLVGITATTGLVRVVSSVWNTSKNSSLAYKCFEIGAASANRASNNELFANYLKNSTAGGNHSWIQTGENPFKNYVVTNSETEDNSIAKYIDLLFESSTDAANFAAFFESDALVMKKYTFSERSKFEDDKYEGFIDWHTAFIGYPDFKEPISIYNIKHVNYFYEFINFNYILALGSAIVVAWNMLGVCILLFKRIFEMLIIFLLSPIMTAVAPLDKGNAEKKLRGEFMKRLLSVIGPVFAYNLFFIIINIFYKASPFTTLSTVGKAVTLVFNLMFQLLIIIVGLSLLKGANSMFTSMLGLEDLFSQSDATMKKAIGTTQKVALGAAGGVGLAVRGTAQAIKGAKGAASYISDKRHLAKGKDVEENEEKYKEKKDELMADRANLELDKGSGIRGLISKGKIAQNKRSLRKIDNAYADREKYRGSSAYELKQSKEKIKDLQEKKGATLEEENVRLASIKEEEGKIKAYKSAKTQARKDKLAGSFIARGAIGFGNEMKSLFAPSGTQALERMKESVFGLTGEGAQSAMLIAFDKNERRTLYKSKSEIANDKAKKDKESKEFSEGKSAELAMLKKVVASEKGEDVKKEYTKLAEVLGKAIKDGVLSEQIAAKRNLERFETKHGITKNAEFMQASINNINNPNHDRNMELLNSYLSNARKEAEDKGTKEAEDQIKAQAKANTEALEKVMKDPLAQMASGIQSLSENMKGSRSADAATRRAEARKKSKMHP